MAMLGNGLARMRFASFILATALVCGAAASATAQDASSLASRLDRVERDLSVVQRQLYRGGQSGDASAAGGEMSSEATANLFAKISQLEEQMRDLTGQIEDLTYKIDQNKQRMDRMQADIDFRLQALEKGGQPGAAAATDGGAAQSQAQPQSSGTSGVLGQLPADRSGAPRLTPPASSGSAAAAAPAAPAANDNASAGDAYREAFRLLQRADYPAAETAFKNFLKTYPNTEYAGNAQYWLGETYYVRGQFEPAAVAFADGYKKYRKGPKAPDSLLKLGFSMRKLNKTEQACAALDQLMKEYPDASKSRIDLAQKTRAEMKCR